MSVPIQGGTLLQAHDGVLHKGLSLGGTYTLSGTAAGLSSTKLAITFHDPDFPASGSGKRPVHIRFKADVALNIYCGDPAGNSSLAADTWSNLLPCTALFEGREAWHIVAASDAALEYEILYV